MRMRASTLAAVVSLKVMGGGVGAVVVVGNGVVAVAVDVVVGVDDVEAEDAAPDAVVSVFFLEWVIINTAAHKHTTHTYNTHAHAHTSETSTYGRPLFFASPSGATGVVACVTVVGGTVVVPVL